MTSLDMFPQPVIDSILRDHGVTKKDGYTIITKRVGITCLETTGGLDPSRLIS